MGVAMFDVLTGTRGHQGAALPLRAEVVSAFVPEPVGNRAFWEQFVPRSALSKIAVTSSGARASVEFDLGDDELLDLCVRLLGRGRVIVVATSTSAEEGTIKGPSFGNFRFFSQSGVSPLVPHEHWSFGQKRLLTFFWYLACNPDVVVADELVNGLHWDWIDACVNAIGTRRSSSRRRTPCCSITSASTPKTPSPMASFSAAALPLARAAARPCGPTPMLRSPPSSSARTRTA